MRLDDVLENLAHNQLLEALVIELAEHIDRGYGPLTRGMRERIADATGWGIDVSRTYRLVVLVQGVEFRCEPFETTETPYEIVRNWSRIEGLVGLERMNDSGEWTVV